jgi:hypothetical protein
LQSQQARAPALFGDALLLAADGSLRRPFEIALRLPADGRVAFEQPLQNRIRRHLELLYRLLH